MSWASICGHETQTRALRHALKTERVPHAIILAGPRQVGKTTVANLFAQSLLCARQAEGASCGECDSCKAFAAGGHPEFDRHRPVLLKESRTAGGTQETIGAAEAGSKESEQPSARGRWDWAPESMAASVHSIDPDRRPPFLGLRQRASRRPVMSRRKVILVEEADHMLNDAQDSMLKTIEEHSAGLSLLLVAENLTRLQATIRSRCWLMPFSLVPAPMVERWLLDTLPVEVAQARRLAANACGRPGAAWRRWKNPALLELDARLDDFVNAMGGFAPVKALRLAEQFEHLADDLFAAERKADPNPITLPVSGHAPKIQRSSGVHLIDELALRLGQQHDATRLDALLEAKHHLLQNANIRLALDVMFLRCAG